MRHSTLHILSDFNRTLTTATVWWKKTPSLISVLRDHDFLDEEYSTIAHTYFDQYSPLEQSADHSFEERKVLMHEWRSRHFDLLIEKGLSKEHLHEVTSWGYLQLRPWVKEFLKKTHTLWVPFVIISANGLWAECIRQFLQQKDVLFPNIHIISNEYIWDENRKAIGIHEPIIHSLNKDETTLHEFPFYQEVMERKNILLLWDSLWDLAMSDGFSYESRTTIWFLNDLPDASHDKKKAYSDAFDYVVEWDWTFEKVDVVFEKLIS